MKAWQRMTGKPIWLLGGLILLANTTLAQTVKESLTDKGSLSPIPDSTANLGLVARLAGRKAQLEALAVDFLGLKTLPAKQKQEFKIDYNEAQQRTDRILLQLTADMRAVNKLTSYTALNEAAYLPQKVSGLVDKQLVYWKVLQRLDGFEKQVVETYSQRLATQQQKDAEGGVQFQSGLLPLTLADITPLITAGADIIEKARAAREAKVGFIVDMLTSLRLKSLQDLEKAIAQPDKSTDKGETASDNLDDDIPAASINMHPAGKDKQKKAGAQTGSKLKPRKE